MNIGFIMEIGLGHTTVYKNLRAAVEKQADITPTWIEITFDKPGFLFRLPKLRNDIVLRAGVQAYQKLARATRGQHFDALFFHTQLPSVLCHSFMARTPSVISIDCTPKQFLENGKHYGLKNEPTSFLQRRNEHWYRRAFQAAAGVFSMSQWAADSVVHDYGVPTDRSHVFYQGVDLSTWKHSPQQDRDGVRLLFVGGEFYRKGGELLLRWMRDCAPPWCSLDIVTRDTIPETPRVTVHQGIKPNSETLKELYANADLFVFPTFADISPLVLTEAMACGLPILTTTLASIPELVAPEPGMQPPAVLIPPENWGALHQELTRLVHDKPRLCTMGKAARALAESRFNGMQNFASELDTLREIASTM